MPNEDERIGALTARLVRGDDDAWQEFHSQYFDRLLRYLLVLCRGDEHAARERLQSTFVKIARNVRRFDREDAWWSWLTVVARTCTIDDARRRSRYHALLERYGEIFRIKAAAPPPPKDPLPGLLEDCLNELPEDDRTLLTARYHDNESIAELATHFDCSEKAVESRLVRLRRRLKDQLLRQLRDEI